MLAAARRRRAEAYGLLRAYLAGEGFRRLRFALAAAAIARPWEGAAGASLDTALPDFAAGSLGRQWRRLMAAGPDLTGLPAARLHEVRIEAKRMRYAAELFAPLFRRDGTGRFIARTTDLQDCLGHLNDGATAAALMAALGPAGGGFAGGAVRGLVAGRGGDLRGEAQEAWRRLRKAGPFWM
jgi:CHAD domain-containing protein